MLSSRREQMRAASPGPFALGLLITALWGCSSSNPGGEPSTSSGGSSGTGVGGSTETGGAAASGGSGSASSGGFGGAPSSGGTSTGGASFGHVDLVPFYEAGSAWEANTAARAMVDALFSEVEGALLTGGSWDATIEVYLTDDNPGTANTYFDAWSNATIDGHEVAVVSAWAKIMLDEADQNGPADTAGNGFDFAVSFNVAGHAGNPGLLRHELMHGLGAVNLAPNPSMSASNSLDGLASGSWVTASVYDLALVDRQGNPLLGNYDDDTQQFQVLSYDIEPTYAEWTDGNAGLSFRGIADAGGDYDMPLLTVPDGADALLLLNEPTTLMSAGEHPTWDHLAEPDRAFFRALGYRLSP